MKNYILSFLFISILIGSIIPAYAQMPYHDFPPTPAFRTVGTQNGTIYAKNYYYPLNITGTGTVSVKSSNSTHTITISNANGANQGSYNTTQANNVNENVGGYQINFINGTGSTVNVVNSHSGHQVNVTIASTGSGGTITGSGATPQMTYWTGTSSIGGAANMLWDNANNVLKGLSDVTTSLGTSSLRFLNIFASVINGTTVRANNFTTSTGTTIYVKTPTGIVSKLSNSGVNEYFPATGNSVIIGDSGCGSSYIGIGLNSMSGCSDYRFLMSSGVNDLFINHPTGGTMYFRENNNDQMRIISGGNIELIKRIDTYNNTATAGEGVPAIIGIDNRHGLTAVDGSARTMFTTTDSTPLYEVIVDEEASSFVSGNMVYTVNWTENGGNNLCQITVNSVLLQTTTKLCLANPDPSSAFKVQLTGPFVGTVTVSAVVERLG